MTLSRCLIACSLLGSALPALACYTVYGDSSRVLYRSAEPPVDMSRPIHETLARRFPGGHLVFDLASTCEEVPVPARAVAGAPASRMFTDRVTAQALGLSYRTVATNIVLVEPAPVAMRPGVNTVPAVASAPRLTRGTVITELHNPPMTIVETEAGVRVGGLSR